MTTGSFICPSHPARWAGRESRSLGATAAVAGWRLSLAAARVGGAAAAAAGAGRRGRDGDRPWVWSRSLLAERRERQTVASASSAVLVGELVGTR